MPTSETGTGAAGMTFSVRDGTGRFAREADPLGEGFFKPDELRFEQIVAMARRYASLVLHHDLDDVSTGPWTDLFSGSEIATMAAILAAPVDALEKDHLAGRSKPPFASNEDLLDLLEQWVRALGRSQGKPGQELRSLVAGLSVGARESYLASLQAIRIAQATARRLLGDAMVGQDQDPASAMLFTFARLHARLQERLGRFATRRTDFYYRRVLGASPRPGIADTVDLVLPTTVDKTIEIPSGTEFLGVGADGEDIVYATDEPATIDGARVEEVLTLHLAKEADDETGSSPTISGTWCDRIDGDSARPLFGAPREEIRSPTAWSARIGFVLADGVLLLREGLSRVRVDFEYTTDSVEGSALAPTSDGKAPTRERIDEFHKAFRNCFKVSYTGPTGWTPVAEYMPSCWMTDSDITGSCLRLDIAIPSETHPVVPYSPDLHGDEYGSALPMLRFELNDQDAPHPYGTLSRLVVRRVSIEVEVHDCRNLSIHNQIGPLTPHSPFAPFGPLPAIGSHLVVGLGETRSKNLTACRLHLRWDGLPPGVDGFRHWYADYDRPMPNDAFAASLSVLADGRWLERPGSDAAALVPLFSTAMDNGTVTGIAPETEIDLAAVLSGFKPVEPTGSDEPLEYGPTAKGGFFRLSLASPKGAFGHAEYPQLLTRTMMRNARVKLEKLASPMPNPPYTPVIASISMDYAATSVLDIENRHESGDTLHRNRLIHLHPFGWDDGSRRTSSRVGQIPDLGSEGNLYIGLRSHSPIRRVSLHFHLRHDSRSTPPNAPRWWHLDGDSWRPLPNGSIKRDTTSGLTKSGIVALELPESGKGRRTLMPQADSWLRVGTDDSPEKFCQILSVRAQAIQARRRTGATGGRETDVVAGGTVVSARRSIPGVERILQPAASQGGRRAEDAESFRLRMSRRLRHKGRAVEPLDFEQLVLERFPEVYKAKCFANLAHALPVRPAPGQILVVPIPYPPTATGTDLEATLNGDLLDKIRQFLQTLCSDSAQVDVINPSYERLQVHCTVRFRGEGSNGSRIDALNRAIRDWISPWTAIGNHVHFGWKIRRQELHAFLEGLDFVDRVDHFSLLRLSSGADHRFRLDDTGGRAQEEIVPSAPWAVAVPMDRHLVGESTSKDASAVADPTGLGELAIGSTFVIPGSP